MANYLNAVSNGEHDSQRGVTVRRRFISNRIEVINSVGKKIVGYLDTPVGVGEPWGVVLIAPAYGETKESNLHISAYLAVNGFYGLRFDWTDHVGESDGDIFVSTLSKMQRDLIDIIDHLKIRFPSLKLGILAMSLAARVALKVIGNRNCAAFLICFTPVVNLQDTLKMVYREDLVENYRNRRTYGTLDILGFSIDADSFLSDAIDNGFADLRSTEFDATKIDIPTFFFLGDRDSWVRALDAKGVFENVKYGKKELFVLPDALHRIDENRVATEKAVRLAVGNVIKCIRGESIEFNPIQALESGELDARESEEKNHLKDLYSYSKSEEQCFWKNYLGSFQYIIHIADYYALLESIYARLGGAWPAQRILDAGCGMGNYGFFLLTKQMYRLQQNLQYLNRKPVYYFGVDFVSDAICEASRKIAAVQDEFKNKLNIVGGSFDWVRSNFVLADLETMLPFPDGFFDQICCNLVISYLRDPPSLLRELWRVLRPGGKMVASSLKPNADLSEIYRNFVSVAESAAEIEEGRKLLSNAGLIKRKEVAGVYHFYSEKELRVAIRKAGFYRAKTFRSFGNQANLIVCSKIAT